MNTVAFGRGGGGVKAPKAAKAATGPAATASPAGQVPNGTVNGKKGFQPGNKYGAGGARNHPAVKAARAKHTAASRVARSHVKKGTALSKEGRAAIRAAAAAHRELQTLRAEHGAKQTVEVHAPGQAPVKVTRPVVAPGQPHPAASAKPAAPKAEAAKPTPTIGRRVAASAKEAGAKMADHAATHIVDLKAGVRAGAIAREHVGEHVDRIAKGASKDQLFAAAKAAGIDHAGIKTKKALVDRLKNDAYDHGKPATLAPAKVEAPKAASAPHQQAGPAAAPAAKAAATPARHRDTFDNRDGFGPSQHDVPARARATAPLPAATERKLHAAILSAVHRPEKHGIDLHDGGFDLLPKAHSVRAHVERAVPEATAGHFNQAVRDLVLRGKLDAVNYATTSGVPVEHQHRGVAGVNATVGYLTRPAKQDFSHGPKRGHKS